LRHRLEDLSRAARVCHQRRQSAAQVAYAGRTAQILQAVSQDGTALTVTTAS